MPTNEKDNLELYEDREHELLEKLGRMESDDPNYGKVVGYLDTVSKIRVNYETSEQTRLNNNARNSIEEEKLIIEHAKIQSDKDRTKAMWIQALLSFVGGAALTMKSYHMDESGYPYKDLKVFGMKLIERVRGR